MRLIPPLLALAVLLPCAAVAALDAPPWGQELSFKAWRQVTFTDAAGIVHDDVYCRYDECGRKTGEVPLYVLTETGQRTYTDGRLYPVRENVKPPTQPRKISYASKISQFKFDVSKKTVVYRDYKFKPGVEYKIAKTDASGKAYVSHEFKAALQDPTPTTPGDRMIVASPSGTADDASALRPVTTPPARKAPPLRKTPTLGKSPTPTPPAPVKIPENTPPPAEIPVKAPELGKAPAPPSGPISPVKPVETPTKTPAVSSGTAASPESAQDLKPLTPEELKNLTKADQIVYAERLKGARAKLEEAKKKNPVDGAGVLAANEEISAIITEFRKKAADNVMKSIPKNVAELNALPKPQQEKFCADLMSTAEGGYVEGFQVVTGAMKQADTAAASDEKASGIIDAATKKAAPEVTAAPLPQIEKTEADKIRARCKELMRNPSPSSGEHKHKGNITGPAVEKGYVKGPTCTEKQTLEDDKCVPKKDKDGMILDIKAGAIGAAGGAVIGLLGGPIGAVVGAAIGFAAFYYANKALR